MDIFARSHRLWSLDLSRGFFIFTMLLAHSLFFFHAPLNPLLQAINGLADIISFTGLIFIAGATAYVAYLGQDQSHLQTTYKALKRLGVYLLSYYLLTVFIGSFLYQPSLALYLKLVTFQTLIPFTEFIIPFIILGLLKIPLRPIYQWLVKRPILGLSLALASFSLAFYLSPLPTHLPPTWKAIWVYQPGSYSFSILHYFPIYLYGIYFGAYLTATSHLHYQNNFISRLILIQSGLSLFWLVLSQLFPTTLPPLWQRWPPSPLFLLLSSLPPLILFLLIIKFHDLRRLPWTRSFLLVLGQNAFALFVTHTALIYTYQFLGFPRVYSSLLVIVLWLASLLGSIFFAKIIPFNFKASLTLINWCECQLGICIHAQEPQLITQVKHWLLKFSSLSRRLSFHFGRRQIQPLKTRSLIGFLSLFFLLATPLGLVENQIISQSLDNSLNGQLSRRWVLVGQDQPLSYSLDLSLLAQTPSQVTLLLNQQPFLPLQAHQSTYTNSFYSHSFSPGIYNFQAQINLDQTQLLTPVTTLSVSAPLYVVWTLDWEGYDVPDLLLDRLSALATAYDIPLTQLFNPRIYTTDTLSPARAKALTAWVTQRSLTFGDEIGLHLHMFPDFVQAAGLIPKLEPVWGGGFSPGYDILTTAYSTDELITIINYAKKLFALNGLPQPQSYRAGAWFADLNTLHALDQTGFTVDTSARTAYTFGTNNLPGPWDITITQTPYHPSFSDQNRDYPSPNFRLLEIPNNGADDYAFSAQSMIDRFKANYSGGILTQPVQVTFLSHPHWLTEARAAKMQAVFNVVMQSTLINDSGPAVFATLQTVYQAFNSL